MAAKTYNWCVRYCNTSTGKVSYSVYIDWTTREIDSYVTEFTRSHSEYYAQAFKFHKKY